MVARTKFVGAWACALFVLAVVGDPLPSSAQAIGARVVSHGDRNRPAVALTFDDGVSPQNCRRILAILLEHHVPATFFPIAAAMPLDPALWQLVATAGYPVGDHTLTHPQMPTLSLRGQVAQIARARTLAESVLGRPLLRVFRPPYGAYNAGTIAAAAQAGFGTVLLWDVSDRDTSRHGTVAEMVSAAERGTNGSVVLMHCGPNATPYLLAQVIDFYQNHGFRLVTVPTLLGLTWSAGPTSVVTPTEVLGDLAPLPPAPSGGPITGPNGYSTPPAAPPASPTSPPSLPSKSAPPVGSSAVLPTGPNSTPSASAVVAADDTTGSAATIDVATVVVLGLVIAAVCVGVATIARLRRAR